MACSRTGRYRLWLALMPTIGEASKYSMSTHCEAYKQQLRARARDVTRRHEAADGTSWVSERRFREPRLDHRMKEHDARVKLHEARPTCHNGVCKQDDRQQAHASPSRRVLPHPPNVSSGARAHHRNLVFCVKSSSAGHITSRIA